VGPAADVYSIATILYQMLAGRTPFSGETAVEVLGMQMNHVPPPLRSIERASYVPDPIAALVMQNLAKRPEQRCPDAQALGRALAQAARAGGLAPEDLVPRSPLLGAPGRQPAFASVEPTRQLPLSPQVIEPSALRDSPEAPLSERPPARSAGGGALAFLIGCLLGGVVLAVLGARGSGSSQESSGGSPAPEAGLAEAGATR
jgi:serine/threonine protein kinase